MYVLAAQRHLPLQRGLPFPAQYGHMLVAQVTLLLRFLATPAGAAAVSATLAIPQADRAAIIGLPGLVDATQARRACAPSARHCLCQSITGCHQGSEYVVGWLGLGAQQLEPWPGAEDVTNPSTLALTCVAPAARRPAWRRWRRAWSACGCLRRRWPPPRPWSAASCPTAPGARGWPGPSPARLRCAPPLRCPCHLIEHVCCWRACSAAVGECLSLVKKACDCVEHTYDGYVHALCC